MLFECNGQKELAEAVFQLSTIEMKKLHLLLEGFHKAKSKSVPCLHNWREFLTWITWIEMALMRAWSCRTCEYMAKHRNCQRWPFSQQKFWFTAGKAQVLLITLTITLFYSSVPLSTDSVTVSQHAHHQDSETAEAVRWTLLIPTSVRCRLPNEK